MPVRHLPGGGWVAVTGVLAVTAPSQQQVYVDDENPVVRTPFSTTPTSVLCHKPLPNTAIPAPPLRNA